MGGAPHDYANPDAYQHLDQVRSLIFQGKVAEAERLAETMMGEPKLLMPYQSFCNLHLHFDGQDVQTGYHRGLDLTKAVADTEYTINGVSFRRESFVSFPDQVLVVHMTASEHGQITFRLGMDSSQPGTQVSSGQDATMELVGQIQPRQNPPFSWTGSWDKPGLRFAAKIKVLAVGGTVRSEGDHLEITGADAVTLVFSNATSFRSYRDISGDAVSAARDTLQRALTYWQADAGDLWETERPLWGLISDLQQSGAITAREQYHSQGWVLHHNTDLWRGTAPVDGPWGIWPMGQAWLANQMWDHYLFSGDRQFLAQQAYPAMKEAAEFSLGFLVEIPAGLPFAGRLATNPSTSPENAYLLDGEPAHLTYAPTMDIELTNELFESTRAAAHILGKDADFSAKLAATQQRLPPLQTGPQGQLQEWIQNFAETEPHHRHMSHLYSLYPGHDIDLERTPALAAAARKSMELRGNGSTGWSDVWRVGLWARLHDADGAYTNLKLLLTQMTLPNMFDLCPPFQIDGNLGGPAVMMEMLVQSTPNEITLLPALPSRWPEGSLKGVRVRGGGKADITWKGGQLTEFRLQVDHPVRYRITYNGKTTDISAQSNRPLLLDGSLQPVPTQAHQRGKDTDPR